MVHVSERVRHDQDMSKKSAAIGAGNHAAEPQNAALSAFEQAFKMCLKQKDAERAAEVLAEAMEAKCSIRTTVMCQVVFKGVAVVGADGRPVLEPRDAYEIVPDHTVRVRAAELAMAYLHGYPVKRSANIEAKAFIPLDQMLGDSPIYREHVEKTKVANGKEVS